MSDLSLEWVSEEGFKLGRAGFRFCGTLVRAHKADRTPQCCVETCDSIRGLWYRQIREWNEGRASQKLESGKYELDYNEKNVLELK